MASLFIGLAVAFAGAVFFTPLVMRIAHRIGLVDRPDGHRKLHSHPIALGGGVAIACSAFLGGLSVFLLDPEWARPFTENIRFLLGLTGAAALICAVGLADDWLELRGRQKLAAQFLTVLIVCLGGLAIETVDVFGFRIELGLLAVPITVCWLLGTINALNLIDGVDGLATTVGIVLSGTMAIMAWMTGHHADALVAASITGGLSGFLIFNFPPAKIYMGDAGSMTIGLVLGALAIRSSLKGPATVAMAAPFVIWTVLLFDVGAAIVRRKLTGQSVYTTDRGHLHHVLQKKGFSRRKIVATVGFLCLICGAAALVSVYQKSETMGLVAAGTVIASLIISRLFGHSEFVLVMQRIRTLLQSMFRIPIRPKKTPKPVISRFNGHRDWEQLWASLIEFAEQFDLSVVQLNVNSPSIGEEYHAFWERKEHPPLLRMWRLEVPLFHGKLAVGRLFICGTNREDAACTWMGDIVEGLRPFEQQMRELLDTPAVDRHSETAPAQHKIAV